MRPVIEFSSDRPVTIDPGKSAKINSGFYIHQKGDHLIHFEMIQFHSSLLLLPNNSSQKIIGPNFKLMNFSEFLVTIPSHKKIFRATFIPLDDVDLYHDVPMGYGAVDLEEREKDLYAVMLLECKQKKKAERERLAKVAGKVIADAVKEITDKGTQVD